MSFLDKAFPVLIVVVLLIYDIFCSELNYRRLSNTNYSQSAVIKNENRYQNNWINQAATPWPALGQRSYWQTANYSNINPVNPVQFGVWNNNNGLSSNFMNTNSGSAKENGGGARVQTSSKEVTDEELRAFSESLLNKDENNAANYVSVNVQAKTTSRSNKDEAPLPLLSVEQNAYSIPTIAKLTRLYDNFAVDTSIKEDTTAQEQREESDFLDAVIDTKVMEYTRKFLIDKGAIGEDVQEFKDILNNIWFHLYPRGGKRVGSSGFEHVFLAEIKRHEVSGLHNWIYFNEEEARNQANYLGYMKKIDLANKGSILKYHFTFHGIDKPVGSMFIGTSPEFEMALYTTCFLIRADKVCPLKLDGKRFVIRTFTYTYKGNKLIGSAFPEI